MRTSKLLHCWLQLWTVCTELAINVQNLVLGMPPDTFLFLVTACRKARQGIESMNVLINQTDPLPSQLILFGFMSTFLLEPTSIVCPMKLQCYCLLWWLFPALMACWQLIDGLNLLLKDPAVAVLAGLEKVLWCCCHGVLDCNTTDLLGMASL